MKAIQLLEPKKFQIVEIDEPGKPGSGDVLVRVHRVGICGTDYSGYLGKMPFYTYPTIPGHELGVEIVEVGEDVKNVTVGQRCSIEPYMNCQECFVCKTGKTNCCLNLKVIGVHTDGGMRSHFILPARKLHPSTSLEFEQLALVETLAIGCHCVDRADPVEKEHVLVIGAGPIGLSTIEFLRLKKATITVMDLVEGRLEFCKSKMGVDHAVLFTPGSGSEVVNLMKITDGQMPTCVIDATGSPFSMSNAVNYLGYTGRLVYVGITTQEICFPHVELHRREASILASRNAMSGDFDRIIKLIEDGQIDTEPWITHRVGFDDMIGEFEQFTKPETGVIKAIVELE
jgi:2-desacetyl-2-hydroxyethyl bacteriochlorophyllide A dehydrogenase